MIFRVSISLFLCAFSTLAAPAHKQYHNGGYAQSNGVYNMASLTNQYYSGNWNTKGLTNQYQGYGNNYKGQLYNNYPTKYNAYYSQNYVGQPNLHGKSYYGQAGGNGVHTRTIVPIPYPFPSGVAHTGYPPVAPVLPVGYNPYLNGGNWFDRVTGGFFRTDTGKLLGTVAAGTLIFRALG